MKLEDKAAFYREQVPGTKTFLLAVTPEGGVLLHEVGPMKELTFGTQLMGSETRDAWKIVGALKDAGVEV